LTAADSLGRWRGAIRAMARLRWEMFRSGLRSIHGLFDLGATGITWMIYGVLGGAWRGHGVATYFLVSNGA
jgi:hypothetical protein